MTGEHVEFRQDVAAYALGSLDPDDAERFERHLATCDECQALLDEYQRIVALMPLALQQIVPPPDGAGQRLLASARAARPASPTPTEQPIAGRAGPWGWKLIAAASLLLAIILSGWLAWILIGGDDDEAPLPGNQERVVALSGSPDAPEASAHLVLGADGPRATLIASNLPPVGEGRAYQFWFVGASGERVSGGVFSPDSEGGAVVDIDVPDDVSDFELVGVTEEPAGGSPGPTGTNVLRGELPPGGLRPRTGKG